MDTEFYLGGGLAFLIAILGWGDQIRGKQERTRLIEQRLLEDHGFRWSELQPLTRPDHQNNAPGRLASVLRILNAGGLTNKFDASLLTQLENINQLRQSIEKRYLVRFWLVYVMCVEMLLAGILSIFFGGKVVSIPSLNLVLQWDRVWILLFVLFLTLVLYQTLRLNLAEDIFRRDLGSMDDQLRSAKDEREGE